MLGNPTLIQLLFDPEGMVVTATFEDDTTENVTDDCTFSPATISKGTTAITVDYVSGDGTYRGGAISPGMGMRFQALHRYTARLPLCRETAEERLYGTTTTSCIEQGVMNGIAFEIEGYIARFRRENADICIIFTGGAAKNFAKRIKNAIFADCELVFLGLNRILEFNAEC